MTAASDPTPSFACDCMLGRLTRWLRVLGYRAHYFHRIDDARLVRFASAGGHVLLTRDTRLVRRRAIGPHTLVRSNDPFEQLAEVAGACGLSRDPARIGTVCVACNGRPEMLAKADARGLVPPYVWATQDHFTRCPDCRRIYWPSTHREAMTRRLAEVFGA